MPRRQQENARKKNTWPPACGFAVRQLRRASRSIKWEKGPLRERRGACRKLLRVVVWMASDDDSRILPSENIKIARWGKTRKRAHRASVFWPRTAKADLVKGGHEAVRVAPRHLDNQPNTPYVFVLQKPNNMDLMCSYVALVTLWLGYHPGILFLNLSLNFGLAPTQPSSTLPRS